jgi:DNA-directed RNA polymerase specialized sigma subunit
MTSHADVFKYLHDIKTVSGKELKEKNNAVPTTGLWKDYQEGNTKVTGELLKQLTPTINSAVATYADGNNEYRTKAKILALEAVKTYDPYRGTKLETHVFNNLKRLQRLSADRGNVIHIPEQSALDKLDIEKVIKDYEIENGYEPSMSYISDKTGMPIKKIQRLMNIKGQTSATAATGEQGNSLDKAPRTAVKLYEDTLYDELDETNKKIYEWLTGYNGSPLLSRQEVARKLKITPAALSQRIGKIDKFFASNGKRIEEVVYGRNL